MRISKRCLARSLEGSVRGTGIHAAGVIVSREPLDTVVPLQLRDYKDPNPWLVSQLIIEATERLCPLVAIQPVYMHPYSVAKMVTSLAHLYGRRLYLNMVAGGFVNDLAALNDTTPHDRRYERLVEYTTIITAAAAVTTLALAASPLLTAAEAS